MTADDNFNYNSFDWLESKDELVSLMRLVSSCKKLICDPSSKTVALSQDKIRKLNKDIGCDIEKFKNYLESLELERNNLSVEVYDAIYCYIIKYV